MSNVKTWEHKDILNRLAEMQTKPYYAVCRADLQKAELTICALEQERDALKSRITALDGKYSLLHEKAKRLVDHADFKLGGVLSASSKAKEIPSNAVSDVKARHLAALRDVVYAAAGEAPVHNWLLAATQELAKIIAKRCYPDVPQFEVCDDLATVISQIDNMTTGMSRTKYAALATEEWRPIETAPKDGTEFLAWVGHGWNGRLPFVNTSWAGYWVNEFRNGGQVPNFAPTHWRPSLAGPSPAPGPALDVAHHPV